MRLILVAICLYMIWGYSAQADAATPSSTVSTALSTAEKSTEKKFNITVDISVDSNLREQQDPAYAANGNLVLKPSYKISSISTLAARLDVTQKMYADDETAISDLQLAIVRDPIALSTEFNLNTQVFGFLPTNEANRNDNSFLGAVGLAAGLKKNHSVLKKTGTLEGTVSVLKNVHEFERTNLNEANLSHRARYILSLEQNLADSVSLDVVARYQTGWTYQNALKTSFLISESLNFEVSENTSVYVSHTNDGDALKPNGLDSNVKLYDTNTSTWATGITASF